MIRKLLYFVRSLFLNFNFSSKEGSFASIFLFKKMAGPKTVLDGKVKFLFILFFSVFVNSVSGQITQPTAWTKAYDQTTLAGTGANFAIAAGSNRILVVAIATTFTNSGGSGTQADPTTISYGGVTLTKTAGNGATNGRTHTWLYYLKDNAVMDATTRALNVTGGAVTGSTLANMTIWYTVYAGVDQSPATYSTGSGLSNSSTSGPAQLSAAMAVNTNEQAVYISSLYNDTNTTFPSYTINSNWTSGGTNTGTNGGNISWKIEVAKRNIPVLNTTDNAATSTITPSGDIRYAMSAMSLPRAIIPPTITSLGSASGCVGGNITINGTNLTGATAANVKIGGTAVSSITSNTGTQIVAVIGSGTTGTVAVTTVGGTATSASTFTVNTVPTTSNAGPDQYKNTTFTLAANTPGTGNVGTWSIASGPSLSTSQFASGDTSNPTSVFTPSGAGTWALNWTISNGCGTSTDQVLITNCSGNLITNGDFSATPASSGWTYAVNSKGDRVEVLNESVYFGNSNGDNTAELDYEASLGQSVTVIPGVSYTLSFLYARRPSAPANVAVDVKIIGGSSPTSKNFTTNDNSSTPQIGTFTFIPSSSSILIEFYNSLSTSGQTLGSIIDNIVLLPTSQEVPFATTIPKGSYKTLTACSGASVQLNVDNISASDVTYLWSGSAAATFSSTTSKNPTVTFSSSGVVEKVTVVATKAGGCASSASSTFVNVTALPTVNPGAALAAICQGATSAAMGGSVGGGATSGTWSGGAGTWTNATNASTATYKAGASESGSITLTLTTVGATCVATATKTITVNPNPTANAGGALTAICQGATSAAMGGSVGGGATSGTWTGGAGSWTNANNPSTATYTASASESGSITLTLTTSGGSCGSTTATKTITINVNPTANAGGVLTAICQGATSAAMGGSVGGSATGGTWTGGGGTWTNATNASTATYKASASESGSITLTLTTSGGSCGPKTATKTITVNPNPTANAGGALTAICQGTTSAAMGGSVGGGATSGTWTGGAGSWTNATNASTATYTAGASESGSITLTLTTSGGSCGSTTATKTITVNPNPTANAGGALTAICQGATSAAMGGSVGGGATGGTWTGGAGSWTNATNASTATYTAGASESGSITLTLTTSGGSCGSTTATKTITVNPNPTANAGGALTAICQGATSAAMGGSVGGGATSGTWTGGAGTWTNATNASTATYTAGASESGSITLTLTTSGGLCGPKITTKTITVNPNPTANAGGALTAICQGATSAAMGGSVGGGATSGTWTGGVGSWTNATNASTATYTAGASESGSITLTLTTSGGSCGLTTVTKTITVNTLPGTPITGTPTQPTCASSVGTIPLSNLPSSGTWTITQGGSFPGITYTGTGATYNVQNLAPGNYTFTVVGAVNSCSSLASTNVTINASTSKVWTGNTDGNWSNPANWNPAGTPSATDCIVIPDLTAVPNIPSVQGSGVVADAYTITVNGNASLTVNSKNTLKVVGSVTIAPLGSLVFLDQASLVQTTNATNTGNITYHRNTEPVRRYDYTYWSSPITNTAQPYKLKDLSPGTLLDKYQSYNSTTSSWDIHLNGLKDMEPAVGYAVRAPQTFSITGTAIYPAVFTGTPNNGDYPVQIYGTNWSLIGNPYPSAIDAETFININHDASPSVDVGSLYFWTHNSPPSSTPSPGGSYDYTSNDYAVFNLSGSTGTGPTPPPTGDIAACQSFFMKASGPGVVKFTNDMRVDGRNQQFYKTTKSKAIEKNRVWLNLTSNQGAFKQVLVGYIEGATNEWDVNYDATTNNGNSFIDFYSINQAQKLTIQGRVLPFTDTDRIPLGYKSTVAGDFTIAIDHADGLFNNQAVYLEDRTTGKVTDLKAGNYTFTTAIGTFTDRFTIAYTKKTLGTGDFENLENSVFVSIKEKTIKVTSSKETIKEVTIYDINGQLLYNKKKVGVNELQIPNLQSSNQVLLVKVTLDNDFTTTKKIIFQ